MTQRGVDRLGWEEMGGGAGRDGRGQERMWSVCGIDGWEGLGVWAEGREGRGSAGRDGVLQRGRKVTERLNTIRRVFKWCWPEWTDGELWSLTRKEQEGMDDHG